MPRLQTVWLGAFAVAYVGFAAVQARGGWAWLGMALSPLVVVETWRRTARSRTGGQRVEDSLVAALRACVWGALLFLVARSAGAGHATFDTAANLGAGVVAAAALIALARIPATGGLLLTPPAARSLDATLFVVVAWSIATAVPLTRALFPAARVRYDLLSTDYATTTAGVGSLLVLIAASLRLRHLRSLELGVGDRALGAVVLSLTATFVALPAAFLGDIAPDRLLPAAVVVASLLVTWAAATPEPTTVSSALRGILAIAIVGAPLVLGAGFLVLRVPEHGGTIVLSASCLAILVGLVARTVARPLGPEQSRWLLAIEAASRGALQPEPDAAMRAALAALGATSRDPTHKPELWRSDPAQVLTVDRAGYLHTAAGKAPERLYELAREEPERTLRWEALRLAQVRRPDTRPLVEWFEAHRAYSATLVLDEDGPLGFILLPRGERKAPMTLEEARAIRLLADRMSALFAVSSAMARSRERELAARASADQLDDELRRLEHIIAEAAGRHQALAEGHARRVRSVSYSAAAQMAVEQLERAGRLGVPVMLDVPPGVDAVGYAALVHLKGARAAGPFVVFDAASGVENTLAHWQDEGRSPLGLADGGTLLILDAAALSAAVQDHIARWFSQRATTPRRSSILPPGLIVTRTSPAARGCTPKDLESALRRWVSEPTIEIPTLAERADDMQALVLFHLTRSGLRLRGQPLGIEPAALAALLDHGWPGNDLELEDVLLRAARTATGPRLTLADLSAAGFDVAPVPRSELEVEEPPPSGRIRSRRPATRRPR